MKKLETDRLILRKFKLTDAEGVYYAYASDEKVPKYLSWEPHKNIEETKTIIKKWIDDYKNDTYNWIVEKKDTHEIIGNISVVCMSKKHNTAEIGYCYGSKYWGYSYASEALRKVIEYLLLEENFRLIECYHIESNPASGKVMQKAGMKYEGILRKRDINKQTQLAEDVHVYSIIKEEL